MKVYLVFTKDGDQIEEWPDAYLNKLWAEDKAREYYEKGPYKKEDVFVIETEVKIQEQTKLF